MSDERLSLVELKERGKALGYAKILRRLEIAPIVPLATLFDSGHKYKDYCMG
jgi:hypothetical protein